HPPPPEDLAQDALLRALKALPRFRGESSLSTWVYRITINTWKNRVRSEKRRVLWRMVSLQSFANDETGEQPEFKADDPALDANLETQERTNWVHKALQELDEDS